MNIQIFAGARCFDTKKAERYFKERRIKYQRIDILRYGMSRGEFESVRASVGLAAMANTGAAGGELLPYLASDDARAEKMLEDPSLLRTPIVRNGRQATVGYCPDVWQSWA